MPKYPSDLYYCSRPSTRNLGCCVFGLVAIVCHTTQFSPNACHTAQFFSIVCHTTQFSLCVCHTTILLKYVSHNPVFSKCVSHSSLFSIVCHITSFLQICVPHYVIYDTDLSSYLYQKIFMKYSFFWAAAPNGTKSYRTLGDFRFFLSICLLVCLSPPGPLRPEICPKRA